MEKYLPVGSVCTLKGKNKKVMITGFYCAEFNGNLKISDYSGIAYPEGLLLPEFNCSFNHDDIENVDFVGFKNLDYIRFNNLLNGLDPNYDAQKDVKHKNNEWILTSNKSYSKLLFDENGVVVLAEPAKETKTQDIYSFNENGVVTKDTSNIHNPFYKSYDKIVDNKKSKHKPSESLKIFKNIKFDENGTVVSAEVNEEPKENTLNKIEFDENGVVIAANGETLKAQDTPKPQYRFNDDGILISDGVEVLEDEKTAAQELEKDAVKMDYKFDENGNVTSANEIIPPIGPGLPGYVAQKKETTTSSKYQFDENGTVTSVN